MRIYPDAKVAIIHDTVAPHRGAEDALEELARMLPNADILSGVSFGTDVSDQLKARSQMARWIRYLPARKQHYREHVMFRPLAIRAMDLSEYEIIISNCAGFAKGAGQADNAIHVCYCHAPTGLAGRLHNEVAVNESGVANRLLLTPVFAGLRALDIRLAAQPDYFVATSRAVAAQIKRLYGRNAFVIYPPVDTSRFHISQEVEGYLLIVAPLLPQKRIDMVIAACNSASKQLVIVGDGPERARLERLAGPTVRFVGRRTMEEMVDLLSRCEALFCPNTEDDFDTMPIKANASGRPAISLDTGSAREAILDGETGVLCSECSRPAIVEAIDRCASQYWDPDTLCAHSRSFDAAAFRAKFLAVLSDVCGENSIASDGLN
ncbi:MAG TPA: glycosyltransferase [Terracidiphilus sp.]|nr:glycosyltransferase [Terracidiphilus sp.]